MDKCKLCKVRKADKTGSHIIPHFLLKRVENIDGNNKRDHELGFTIGKLQISSHFGRSVSPEKLEEIYGEISETDIKNNKHPLIVDYYFCSECEDRLAQLESCYSAKIDILSDDDYESGISCKDGLLFWVSVFWRLSVHGESGVKLREDQDERLRLILDSLLPYKRVNEVIGIKDNYKLIENLSYKIIKFSNIDNDEAKWFIFHPDFFNSLCLFIAEFIVVLDLNAGFEEFNTIDCFGLNKLILDSPINAAEGIEVISMCDSSRYSNLNKSVLDKITEVYMTGLFEFLDKVHVIAGGMGGTMPLELKREILEGIVLSEKNIGRRLTQEEIKNSTYSIMRKYQLK